MNCKSFEERIALYVGGDLPAEKTREIEEHLTACPECHNLAGQLKHGLGRLNEMRDEPLDEAVLRGIRNQVLSQISSKSKSRFVWNGLRVSPGWNWNYAALAVLVVAILTLALFKFNLFHHSHVDLAKRPKEDVVSPAVPKRTPAPLSSGENGVQATERAGLNPNSASRPPSSRRIRPVAPAEELTRGFPLAVERSTLEISQIVPMRIEPFKIELPKKADPLVIKWVSKDPDIEIIWLVDKKGE
jgi:Putative zinc-finger